MTQKIEIDVVDKELDDESVVHDLTLACDGHVVTFVCCDEAAADDLHMALSRFLAMHRVIEITIKGV